MIHKEFEEKGDRGQTDQQTPNKQGQQFQGLAKPALCSAGSHPPLACQSNMRWPLTDTDSNMTLNLCFFDRILSKNSLTSAETLSAQTASSASSGDSHDQADAEWIVIRTQLRGHNDTPFGRPAPAGPPAARGLAALRA
jgi:hypothetical protein